MPSTLAEQQTEMRAAFYDGAPGILVSGLVWIAAALICAQRGTQAGVWTLLIGGALIHPASTLLTRALGRPAKTVHAGALIRLGMASTIWLILCCAMAYGLSRQQPTLFFPAMMATIGCRYLVFDSLYGLRLYSAMGASLIVAAGGAAYLMAQPAVGAWVGGALEVLFALLVFARAYTRR